MNQIQLKVIREALRGKPAQVPLNKTWEMLHHEQSIGTLTINGLRLNEQDYRRLQQLHDQHRKDDVLDESPKGQNRLETAKIHRNEKSTSKHVFADQLVFASIHHNLPMKSASLPIGYSSLVPTIDFSQLEVGGIARLMVLENAAMLMTLHQWFHCLPNEWQSSLFIYRGQGQNQNEVKELLAQLALSVPVAIYADFDPSGLFIVMNYLEIRPVSIIVPKGWQHFSRNHPCNQAEKYVNQIVGQPSLVNKLAENLDLCDMFALMQTEQLALMQENVLQLNELESVDFVRGNRDYANEV